MPNRRSKRIALRLALAASIAAASAGAASAEEPATAAASNAPNAPALVAEIQRAVRENYVLTDKIAAVEAALGQGLSSGRYDGLAQRQLADRINEDLFKVTRDKHLAIQFDPTRAGMLRGPIGDEITEGPEWERMARTLNHGFTEMRVLDGNVRYLNLQGFVWTGPKTAEAFDNAMRFLKEGEAAIIDLRYNGGGSPKAIQYLISHFVEPNKPLMTFYMGGGKAPQHDLALVELPAGRMIGKPIYVLTSKISISAAEAFASLVRGYKLGRIVGETTAGAAYRNSFFPIAGQYMLSVSVGRGEVGSQKENWEGVGIAPDIKADAAQALDAAHLHALRTLAQTAPPPEKMMMEAKTSLLAAKLSPVKPALALQSYAGEYADRFITVEGEALFSQRKGGPRTKMIPLGANLFILENDPSTRIEYAPAGEKTASLEVIRGDGSRHKQERVH